MRYEIEAGGSLRRVTVSREGDGFAVDLDGRLYQVDAAPVDSRTLSLIVDSTGAMGPAELTAGRPAHVRSCAVYDTAIVTETGTGRVTVAIGAVRAAVVLDGRRHGRHRIRGAVGAGPRRVVAPMPGKVVRVLVNPGDSVRARQAVVVVEAMKMENELRADRDGIVSEVHAREGSSVEAGTLLVVIQ